MEWLKASPLAAFAVALGVTFSVTPFVRQWAIAAGAVAKPDARRLHQGHIAQWGGLAIYLGVLLAAMVWRQPAMQDWRQLAPAPDAATVAKTGQTLHLTTTFFVTGLLMLILGMLDDRIELKPWQKFGGQIAIAVYLWNDGVRITTLPFTGGAESLSPVISMGLTVLWVLALTNGINFIDGVDGLASGVCAIAAGSLCLIQLDRAPWAAGVSAALCGACIGFLRHNFHPAKIFLGDAGALLLGFWLATISMTAAAKTAAATTLALPLLVLGIPVIDTIWAVVRRTLAGVPPWKADRGHLHHRLLAKGFSPVKTVLVMYGVGIVLGVIAVIWAKN